MKAAVSRYNTGCENKLAKAVGAAFNSTEPPGSVESASVSHLPYPHFLEGVEVVYQSGGKRLSFTVTLEEIRDQTDEELIETVKQRSK